jgi:hypothetical protein
MAMVYVRYGRIHIEPSDNQPGSMNSREEAQYIMELIKRCNSDDEDIRDEARTEFMNNFGHKYDDDA